MRQSHNRSRAQDNLSLANNRAGFDRIRFKPRGRVDVSQRAQDVTIFGHRFDSPFGIALMVTIDVPVRANRENNLRSGFTLPLHLGPKVMLDGLLHPCWRACWRAP